jgi:prepilin-type N-terminal cleavage/methylation domain-containing protein
MNLNRSLRTYQKLKLYPIADTSSGLKRLALAASPLPANSKSVRGMTLVELMVAIAVGSMILGVIATASMTSALWFAALANYVDMDARSRNALDQMTLKIRQAGTLTEFSPTHLKFVAPGQTNSFLAYDWDSATGSLMEWNTGNSITNTLLTGCDQLAFSLYNASFTPTTNLSQCKALSVNWKCSRTTVGRTTTEDMQQALIVMRNQP